MGAVRTIRAPRSVSKGVAMRILILGGTGEARELADRLVEAGHTVMTTLAGRTAQPHLPRGEVRIGGFGGVDGLVSYLREAGIERVIDATHPFATEISAHATSAAAATGIALIRLQRPAWEGADWLEVDEGAAAAAALPGGARVLVTSGGKDLDLLLARTDCAFIVRLIEPPARPLPRHARLLLARPPFREDAEIELMWGERITHLVSKNSGGTQTPAKLNAARALNVRVILIGRPPASAGAFVGIDGVVAAIHDAAS